MASPLGAKGIVAVDDGRGSSIAIQIDETPGLSAKSLSFSTWGAAFVLSSLLHKISLPFIRSEDGKIFEVLELGAGTGLVGMSSAVLWKCNVLLTDLASILPGLVANVEANRQILGNQGVTVSCASLDWNSPSTIHMYDKSETLSPTEFNKASVILAADTLYDTDHAPLMANTIIAWLASGSISRAVLCYPLRFAYVDCIREFWDLMESNGFECVQEGREMGRPEWNEVPGTEFEWCVWKWKDDRLTT